MANPDRGYKDRLVDLRNQLAESVKLGLVNPELFQQQLIQMLNGIESIKQKSQSEIERLVNMIGEERGRVKACNDMGDLVVNIVSAFVNQENNRLAEEARLANERAELDAYAKQEAKNLELPVEAESKTLPPGVNIIKSKKLQ